MECKLSEENTKLLNKIEELKKDRDYWRTADIESRKMNREWCDRADKMVDDIEIRFFNEPKSNVNLEQRLFNIFKHYADLLEIKGEKPLFGQCGDTCCNQYLSKRWRYCPNCGTKVISDEPLVDKFKRITEKMSAQSGYFEINKLGNPIIIQKTIRGDQILETSVWNTDLLKLIVEFVEEFSGARLPKVTEQFCDFINGMKEQ